MSLHLCIGCFREISSDCDVCPHCEIKYPFERGNYKCLECKVGFIHPLKKEACNKCGSKSYSFVSLINSRLWNKYITIDDIDSAVEKYDIKDDVELEIKTKYKKIRKILYPLFFIFIFTLIWVTRNDTTDNSLTLIAMVFIITVFVWGMLLAVVDWALYKFFIHKEVLAYYQHPALDVDIPKLDVLSKEVGIENKQLINGYILHSLQRRLFDFSSDEYLRRKGVENRLTFEDGVLFRIEKNNNFYVPPLK